ncbi:MAG: hypothetical protein QXI12_08020 [Candidatus Methanomethyliaceae archaeon]
MAVMTVAGPIEPCELGLTLMHEHLFFDFRCYFRAATSATERRLAREELRISTLGRCRFAPFAVEDNLVNGDLELVVREVLSAKSYGVRTIVDPTPIGCGRDPVALRRVAFLLGMNIIMGTGYYIDIGLPEDVRTRSVKEMEEILVGEVQEGIHGVKAGLIGEVGTSAPITREEEKSLRAAARAQRRTLVPLMVHLDGWAREGHHVLDIVSEEGAPLEKVVLCHMNPCWHDVDYQESLAERGAYLEYDMMGMAFLYPPDKCCPDDLSVLRTIARLMKDGYGKNILMSQDVFLKCMFRAYGGSGYTHIFENLAPLYQAAGISEDNLALILVDNPRRLFS